ncbi:hypothetical protein GTCCBUS3UF5_4570 [Geobacillus thermoleovorans CCB_US3_UF5]|uniref:Uncharacterized protein n=1 Tax=Geobacillus thermoleovorans CCB_US3_UF5 TaxID=1111068 RepID=A0ABM5MDM6_GEOTH|nr:hypothetical protein GTCCBUS3UF5_4570 [Geobacillus thermoleovorans CCB_US3_UF5]
MFSAVCQWLSSFRDERCCHPLCIVHDQRANPKHLSVTASTPLLSGAAFGGDLSLSDRKHD